MGLCSSLFKFAEVLRVHCFTALGRSSTPSWIHNKFINTKEKKSTENMWEVMDFGIDTASPRIPP
jgi:hypothetical protein